MNRYHTIIVCLLRFDAIGQMTAVIAIAMPHAWMDSAHRWAGLGEMPEAPVVGYLARTLSAFYVMHGALSFGISLDVKRYWPLLRLWAVSFVVIGAVILGIDIGLQMPTLWTASEGPFMVVFGSAILALMRKATAEDSGAAKSTIE